MSAVQPRKLAQQTNYDVDDEDDDIYPSRPISSVRRYRIPRDTLEDPTVQGGMPITRRRASANPASISGMATKAVAPPVTTPQQKRRRFPPVAVLVGMLAMAMLAVSLNAFGSWWRIHQDDVQYGRPRTAQLDAIVGHADSVSNPTHFIFINLNRRVEIIEFPGGDASHARIYTGPVLFGDGQDLTPITGEIRDVNRDGKPDLIVHIQDQRLVYINDGTMFRPLQPGEHINL
jgi:hypothetical protein